jgi:hypothetical protein
MVEKRSFKIVGSNVSETGGNYKGTSPSSAAKKAASMLFRKSNKTTFKFILKEKTQGSEKKSWFYEATIEKLKNPIVIESWKKKDGTPVMITKKVHLRICHHDEMKSIQTSK